MLDHLDWGEIRNSYDNSKQTFVVIDGLLSAENARNLQLELLGNQMWRVKNPVSKHLHNRKPATQITQELVKKLELGIAREFNTSYRVEDFWALLYSRNTDGNVHADFGDLTLTYWLTDDQHNKDPETGGLIIYDVARPDDMPITEYLSSGEASEAYVAANTKGNHTVVPYKFNRAVIFNPKIFHKSNQPNFDLTNPQTMRMNLTLSFRDPLESRRQLEMIS